MRVPQVDDIFVMIIIAVIVVACWTWVFMHPSNEAFGIAVGGTGAFGALFHALRVFDDKRPDAKD